MRITLPSADLFSTRAPSGAIQRLVDAFVKDTLLPAMEQERVGGVRCKRCGRALRSARSVDAGYGPECLAKASVDTKTSDLFAGSQGGDHATQAEHEDGAPGVLESAPGTGVAVAPGGEVQQLVVAAEG